MKSKQVPTSGEVTIGHTHWDVPVEIPLRPYLEFVAWLDAELLELATRWTPMAPPRASLRRPGRIPKKT